jgi:hypothetical protein
VLRSVVYDYALYTIDKEVVDLCVFRAPLAPISRIVITSSILTES